MRPLVFTLLALLMSPFEVQAQAASPAVDRIVIHPTDRTMVAGDTLRLRVEAFDANGDLIPNAQYRFAPAGAAFEASVDENGLIVSGSTGTLPVGVVAMVPGGEPHVERIDIEMVPGPAASVEITPAALRLASGQRMNLNATSRSRHGDVRQDSFEWRSSRPDVVTVDESGRVQAVTAGEATIHASTGGASSEIRVEVVPDQIASVEITPSTARGTQGDVIRFEVTARDANGRAIEGITRRSPSPRARARSITTEPSSGIEPANTS